MDDLQVIRDIAPTARVAPDARIGPFCVVGPDVTIGPGTTLVRRVTVIGRTSIGANNLVDERSVLGAAPQDLKYRGGRTLLIIGHRNRFGQGVTAHVGTEAGGFLTRIGNDNILDDNSHVAHDCYVDNSTRIGGNVHLAGHVRIHDGAVIQDMCGIHHFVTIGPHARVRTGTPVRRDVPPFADFASRDYDWSCPPAVTGPHEAGVRAAALPPDEENELRHALQELFEDEAVLQTKIEQLVNIGVEGPAADLCRFCQESLRGPYGRRREMFRGQAPPEAKIHLPADIRPMIGRIDK